ncbi:DUF2314 domain-containing protein [Lentisphaera profundi]|uniref:DUF2314 domain-containing protein n=1 Tax=Lentisphaera profundi TaxID=1658616 RepID=A0ABY7VTK3_9BACT|nr:DUF2314 domain-containing protein [Lentisphaera profundi]WDE97057.1 DUF2314 domain-containing protein [Lentisphaera profundi]
MTNKFKSVFTPPLSRVFINAENKKGGPLSLNEVLSIKNSAVVVIIKKGLEQNIPGDQDEHDIDPENCWHDWQLLRRSLGYKPDLDPDFNNSFNLSYEDLHMQATIHTAQKSLYELRQLIATEEHAKAVLKYTLSDHESKTHTWLSLQNVSETGFNAQVINLPPGFSDHEIGETIYLRDSEVLDWMVNVDGYIYGAYSLKELRQSMNKEEKNDFDKQLGVLQYME